MAGNDPKQPSGFSRSQDSTIGNGSPYGHKLPPNEAALYKRCDEVLHYVLDPIGVSGSVETRDEYDAYVPPIFALVNENASQVFTYIKK